MKAFAQIGGMFAYFILGLVQWSAQVDGLHQVLHWPSFVCWILSTFTSWLPSLALFLGISAFFMLLVGVLTLAAAIQSRRARA